MTDLRGLLLALAALLCWSISPFFFTDMGKRVGPFSTNLLRLALASGFLSALVLLRRLSGAEAVPPSVTAWCWLAASGVVGLAIGDAFLYRGFVTVGPERTSQIQTLAPAATAAIAWFLLKEHLTAGQTAGMGLILAGVLLATTSAARKKTALLVAEARSEGAALPEPPHENARREPPAGPASEAHPGKKWQRFFWTGTSAAIWSALFQGIGTVLAREAFLLQPELDPLFATTIRIAAGGLALWAYARTLGPLGGTLGEWTRPKVLRLLAAGTVFGPVAGMLCYMGALKYAPAGIVTTVTFMAPLVIIPIGARLYGTRITQATLWGTALSLAGVVLLGLCR